MKKVLAVLAILVATTISGPVSAHMGGGFHGGGGWHNGGGFHGGGGWHNGGGFHGGGGWHNGGGWNRGRGWGGAVPCWIWNGVVWIPTC